MRALVAVVAVASFALIGCGGRSAECTKAVNCGTAVTAVGAAQAESTVKSCENGAGSLGQSFADLCCSSAAAGFAAQAGGTAPAACQ